MKFIAKALAAAGLLAALLVCWHTLGNMGEGTDGKAMQALEDAARRAAVSCYASEGSYPDTLDYLIEHYGLQLDDRYALHYDVFASNLAPDITAVRKPTQEEIWGATRK